MSLNVVTFSSGYAFALSIAFLSFSLPYLIKYSFASLQSSKSTKKQASAPSLRTNSVRNAKPGASVSNANIIFFLSSK